ncbi:MAG TPA: tetratricopeptide repeat protein [Pyrinomonadaceae bacterium]|nr:tetratricopeptide repeat protein [Pyrinomonadaceae bacterium]
MSKRRTTLLVISLVLSFAVLVPQAALGSGAADPTAPAASEAAPAPPARVEEGRETEASEGPTEAADSKPKKRKGNAFARALSAPFRALARLFGGGRKSETAKKSAPAPQTAATQNEVRQEAAAAESKESKPQTQTAAQPAPVPAPKVEPVTTPAAPTNETARTPPAPEPFKNPVVAPSPEGVRIVRPAAGETAGGLRPKMWVPLIVGVPADPVSQGRALLQHGYIQEAIAELQTAATTVGPQLTEANNLLGLAYDRLGWHSQAAEAYGRALTVSPKDWVVLANLGYSLYLADDYAGALKRLNQAAKLAPAEPVIFNNLGIVNARLGRHGDAYKNFAKASNEYDAHVKLAGILEDQRRDKDAVKHYEAALRLQPGASAVLERLVPLYERTGNRDKADSARRALSQPKNPQKTATGGGG